jgi:hypothetical protein
MNRFAFGPKISGFAFPPIVVGPDGKADLLILIAGIRVVSNNPIVDIIVPQHDPATTNYPLKIHAVFSVGDPTEADQPQAWLEASDHIVGFTSVSSPLPATGAELAITVPGVNPVGTYTCQTVLEFLPADVPVAS